MTLHAKDLKIPGVEKFTPDMCKYFLKKGCNNKSGCSFVHPIKSSFDEELKRKGNNAEVCRHFYYGACQYEHCHKLHILDERMITAPAAVPKTAAASKPAPASAPKPAPKTAAAEKLSKQASESMKKYYAKVGEAIFLQKNIKEAIAILKENDIETTEDDEKIVKINNAISESLKKIAPENEIQVQNPVILKVRITEIINKAVEKQQKCHDLKSKSEKLIIVIQKIDRTFDEATELILNVLV